MAARRSRLFLVKSAPQERVKRPRFHTDETVPHTGIYRVRHKKHRLPHDVILLRDQYFPRCAQCNTAVVFELVQAAIDEPEPTASQIHLYELPVIEDDTPMEDDTPKAS